MEISRKSRKLRKENRKKIEKSKNISQFPLFIIYR